jgi:phosphoesterase RecJ-like protein
MRRRIVGHVLNDMRLDASGRVALLTLTRETLAATGGSLDDTDGIINFPLSVKDIHAVGFFKEVAPGEWRVSMRSKGDVDVGGIARSFGGGGHKNAAGCSARGELSALQDRFLGLLVGAVDAPSIHA